MALWRPIMTIKFNFKLPTQIHRTFYLANFENFETVWLESKEHTDTATHTQILLNCWKQLKLDYEYTVSKQLNDGNRF